MSRQWKPGDVAMVTVGGKEIACCFYDTGNERGWFHGLGPTSRHYLFPDKETEPRPLVVIDPEDREQVVRLRKLLNDSGAITGYVKGNFALIQAALRRLIADPKPDEPMGLGAVVEDSSGSLWLRLAAENKTWPGEVWQEQYGVADRWSKWHAIDAVRVLSEGVTE